MGIWNVKSTHALCFQCRMNLVVYVHVCTYTWVCIHDMCIWEQLVLSGLQDHISLKFSEMVRTRLPYFKVKTTSLWLTLTDWYKTFLGFPAGLWTTWQTGSYKGQITQQHRWLCEPHGGDNLFWTLLSGRKVGRSVRCLLEFQTEGKANPASLGRLVAGCQQCQKAGLFESVVINCGSYQRHQQHQVLVRKAGAPPQSYWITRPGLCGLSSPLRGSADLRAAHRASPFGSAGEPGLSE